MEAFNYVRCPLQAMLPILAQKPLSMQRLFYLLHECGLVYITDFTRVGADEFAVQSEKMVHSKQLKQITKAILRMSIAMGIAGGLEPTRVGAAAQQCELFTAGLQT